MVSTHQTNGTASSQVISSNKNIIHILLSYTLMPKKITLIQTINYGSFSTWTCITEKNNCKVSPRVINHCQRSPRPTKKQPVAAASTNVTSIPTKSGEKNEVQFQLFKPTEKYKILTLPVNFQSNQAELTTIYLCPTTTTKTTS